MNILELCYPEQVDNPEATLQKLEQELRDWAAQRKTAYVELNTVIQMAHRADTPSIKLSEHFQSQLYRRFVGRSRSPTRVRLGNKIGFGLAMWPALWWAKRIDLHFDGRVDYTGGQDYSIEIPRIRAEICAM